ncbi:hypothetical protein [Alteribacillus sp. YIM 98480]|uniref:hypothetical protein n=1 Tax=Alteribacillus sp. YIM 98480 TaxID=2606599 RepID=UPI00131D9B6C|nr:hypothetical protein [Alteribacillus sp. YIM 98480]
MSSASAYSLDIPSVRQWKAKYADPPGLVAREQGACTFLMLNRLQSNILFNPVMINFSLKRYAKGVKRWLFFKGYFTN